MSPRKVAGLLAGLACFLLQAAIAAVAVFDLAVAVAGSRRREGAPPGGPRQRRFAVVVPARNEAAVIGRLLCSLRNLTYPRDRFEVLVIADNCSDQTASIARKSGGRVFERRDPPAGKAAAIGWLLAQTHGEAFDAYAIVDADSVVSSNLLEVMDDGLVAGYDAVQVDDGALNSGESPLTALASLGLTLNNRIRPAGRQALGLSPGLMGNGMALSAEAMRVVPWAQLGVTEDSEAHLALLTHGCRIAFDPRASVLSDMPAAWDEAREQNSRWDSGRLRVAMTELTNRRREGPADARYLVAVLDQAIPRTALLAASGGLVLAAAAFRRRKQAGLSVAVLGIQVLGMAPAAAEAPGGDLALALRAAPAFIAWKTAHFLGVLAGRRRGSGHARPGR